RIAEPLESLFYPITPVFPDVYDDLLHESVPGRTVVLPGIGRSWRTPGISSAIFDGLRQWSVRGEESGDRHPGPVQRTPVPARRGTPVPGSTRCSRSPPGPA
ncbi:MAG: hypothetical protein KA967_05365, partial [Methanoculleus sp.]|nr:hypothetical protein [Methanoculleus sp.]